MVRQTDRHLAALDLFDRLPTVIGDLAWIEGDSGGHDNLPAQRVESHAREQDELPFRHGQLQAAHHAASKTETIEEPALTVEVLLLQGKVLHIEQLAVEVMVPGWGAQST
jgi:hypothetical protein